jgi:hypothetical protein
MIYVLVANNITDLFICYHFFFFCSIFFSPWLGLFICVALLLLFFLHETFFHVGPSCCNQPGAGADGQFVNPWC